MNNLKRFNSQELNMHEMKEINGGGDAIEDLGRTIALVISVNIVAWHIWVAVTS